MKKIKNKTVQEWLPMDKIYNNGIIKLKNNKYIKILRVNPINYNLKSDLVMGRIIVFTLIVVLFRYYRRNTNLTTTLQFGGLREFWPYNRVLRDLRTVVS